MGIIPEEDIERVREASRLEDIAAETVVMRQRGAELWGRCPFHQEKTPSFKVNPANQLWYCFGCSQGGDVFKYIMLRENLDFPDAVRYLADVYSIELHERQGASKSRSKRSRLLDVCEQTADFYHTYLMRSKAQDAKQARQYLSNRNMGGEIPNKWNLGYAPGNGMLVAHLSKEFTTKELIEANVAINKNGAILDRFFGRVMFPIQNEVGKTIAFGGRIIGEGEPKYLNSQETSIFNKSKNLYALHGAKEFIVSSGCAIVVEGYTDVIAMHAAGLKNTVATLGTALTEQHVKLLARFTKRIVFLFDGDNAGQKAAERSLQFSRVSDADLYCATLPEGFDPCDYISEFGGEKLQKLISGGVPIARFVIDRRIQSWDLSYPEQRSRALVDALEAILPIRGSLLADEYCLYIADVLSADLKTVKHTYRNLKAKPAYESTDDLSENVNDHAHVNKFSQKKSPALAIGKKASTLERELLGFLATVPEYVRPFSKRIADLDWNDPRFEAIAWAMLATPKGTAPDKVVAAARETVEDADEILSSARVAGGLSDNEISSSIDTLLDLLELESVKRKISHGKAKLRNPDGIENERYNEIFQEVAALQKKFVQLEEKLRDTTQEV